MYKTGGLNGSNIGLVMTRLVRIVPVSKHPRMVCLRVELLGCEDQGKKIFIQTLIISKNLTRKTKENIWKNLRLIIPWSTFDIGTNPKITKSESNIERVDISERNDLNKKEKLTDVDQTKRDNTIKVPD